MLFFLLDFKYFKSVDAKKNKNVIKKLLKKK